MKSVLAALEDGCVAGGSGGRALTHWKAAQGEAGGPRALPPSASRRHNHFHTSSSADPRTLDPLLPCRLTIRRGTPAGVDSLL